MGKEIRVLAYDDLIRAGTGEVVEATHTDVELAFGKRKVTIDLSDASHKALAEFLAPYLAAGTPVDRVNPPTVRSRGRQPDAYYAGMKAYAAERGIEIPETNSGPGKTKLSYPTALRRAWDQELIKRRGSSGLGRD
jgi:hypothetical protein